MPTSLYHLKVADLITQNNPYLYTSDFFLGAIAPDAVNLHGFADKEIRWAAHFRHKKLDKWQQSIMDFYTENKENYPKDFITGYAVHILTDIEADRMESEIHKRILSINPQADKYKEYSNQIRLYELSQLSEEWWLFVKNKLLNAHGCAINNISQDQILSWRDYVLNSYETPATLQPSLDSQSEKPLHSRQPTQITDQDLTHVALSVSSTLALS